MARRPSRSPIFPYTTLFRSRDGHPQLDSVLAQQLGETGERAVDQRLHALQQRAERSGARKGQQVRDPLVETIHLLDDGVQLFAGGAGRALNAALSENRKSVV